MTLKAVDDRLFLCVKEIFRQKKRGLIQKLAERFGRFAELLYLYSRKEKRI